MRTWEKVQAWFVGINVWESKELGAIGRLGKDNIGVIRELLKENNRCCICNEYLFITISKPTTIREKILFHIFRKPIFDTNWGGTCGQGRNYCSDYFCVTHLFADLEDSNA
jgi:hypothetical protein